MQEFSSISVSSYEPDSLTSQLNEQSAAGWDVVAILPTGSTITAYLARESSGGSSDETEAVAAQETVADDAVIEPVVDEPVVEEPVVEEPVVDEPAPQDDHFVVATDPVAASASEPAAEPAAEQAAAAPAGWYADPSSRFELRYWDGTTWTEHVSRGGQQFTDPPVA